MARSVLAFVFASPFQPSASHFSFPATRPRSHPMRCASSLFRREKFLMHFRTLYAVLAFLSFVTVGAAAQYETALQTGDVPFQGYDVNQIDSINLQNGNVSVRIPLVAYPQIGGVLKLSYSAVYNSKSGYAGHICPPSGSCDWVWAPTGTAINCCFLYGNLYPPAFVVTPDGFYGSALNFVSPLIKATNYINGSGQPASYYSACSTDGCHPLAQTDGTYRSTDATGISGNLTTGEVVDNHGVQYFPRGYNNTGVMAQDPYGNTISLSNTGVTDTMARTFSSASSSDSSGCVVTGSGLRVTIWSFPGPNGGTLSFKVCTVNSSYAQRINPSSHTTTITGPTSQSILLPDGRSWVFQYAGPAGELSQITLPTGGTISYTYASEPNSSNSQGNWSSYIRTRSVSDGSHSYKATYYVDTSGETTHLSYATTPDGDDVVHQYQCLASYNLEPCDGFYETSLTYYKGSHLAQPPVVLRSETTSYSYSGTNFGVYQVPTVIETINVTPASKTVTLGDGSTSSRTSYSYDSSFTIPGQVVGGGGSYGDPTQRFDYDYSGLLLHKTVNSYLFQSNSNYKTLNMLDRVQSTTVYNGGSQQMAKTTYGYDEGISPLTGSNTSIQKWLNTTNTSLTTKYAYNSNGTRSQKTDPLLNQTNYFYSAVYDAAYLTQVQEPTVNGVAHNFYYGYDFNTGLKTSETDYNGQITNYSYDGAARPYQVLPPDGGQLTFSYSAPSSQLSITSTKLVSASPSVNIVSTTLFDALHRVSETQLTSDPDGVTYVDTTYDSLSRKATVSNPYRSTSDTTYGITTYSYDPLNRLTSVMQPDGSQTSASYSANCSTATDQAAAQTKSCSDALGRMTGVWEAPSSLNYETDYAYDALANLTTVTQKGGAPSTSWRVRTFTYDSLSRTVCAANPEMQNVTCPASATSTFPAGAETYTYDADSNVIAKTSPAPNQTSASTTVTTSYVYDALNRLTRVSYTGASPATPTVQYGYDGVALSGCTTAPPALTDGYPMGFRTSICDGSGGTSWSHDQMGRVLKEKRKIGTSTALTTTYTYNADGSLNKVTNPGGGKTVTYTSGGAGRPLAAKDGSGNNYVKSAQYTASGGLTNMINGYTSSFAGITTTNAFSNRLQPILFSASSPSGTVFSLCYDFHLGVAVTTSPCNFSKSTQGDSGSPYAILNNRDSTRSQTYTYDSLNRISSGQSSGSQWGEQFTIDPWGNLTNRTGVVGKTNTEPLSVSVGNNDHMSGFGYDAAGNLIQNGSVTFTYDAENRLIWTNANVGFSYIYDGDGSRVEKCASSQAGSCPNGSNATLYWRDTDGGDSLVETDQADTIQNQYIFFGNNRIARLDGNGNVHYYFSDHLGSHAVVENSTGSVCEQDIDYYPYGGVQHDYCAAVTQNYKFTGAERDGETGLDSMKARNYASSLGRLLTPDPGHADGFAHKGDPESWNPYAYAGNNPLRFIDPSGLAHCKFDKDGDQGISASSASADVGGHLGSPGCSGDAKCACDAAGGEWILDPDDQGVKTETVDVKATYTTTEEYIDNVAWFINYAGEQTFGQSLGAFGTVMSTRDPLEFALAGAVVVTPILGSGEVRTAKGVLAITDHTAERMFERKVTSKMIEKAIEKGVKYYDPAHDTYVYVLKGGMASGKDLAVATNRAGTEVRTVMVNWKAVRPRFAPQ